MGGIQTYPSERNGSVAANILLDVRKRYRQHRRIQVPDSLELCGDPVDVQSSTEDQVLGRLPGVVVGASRHRR